MKNTRSAAHVAAVYSLCCLIWGSTWAVIKVGLRDLPPLLFAGTRMALASAILTPFVLRRGWPPLGRADLRRVATLGLFQFGLSYLFVFMAEQIISSSLTAVLFSTFPIFSLLFAHWLLPNEPLTLGNAAAVSVGMLGVLVLNWPALVDVSLTQLTLVGMLMPLGSAMVSSYANTSVKAHLAHVHPLVNLWAAAASGAVMLLTAHLVFERGAHADWTPSAIGSLFYLTVLGTVVSFWSLFWLLPRMPMAAIGVMSLIEMVLAVVIGVGLLGEPITWRMVIGAGMILAGAMAAGRKK